MNGTRTGMAARCIVLGTTQRRRANPFRCVILTMRRSSRSPPTSVVVEVTPGAETFRAVSVQAVPGHDSLRPDGPSPRRSCRLGRRVHPGRP